MQQIPLGASAPELVSTFAVVQHACPWQDGFYLDIKHRHYLFHAKTKGEVFADGDNLTICYLSDGNFSRFRIIQRNTRNVSPVILAFDWTSVMPTLSVKEQPMNELIHISARPINGQHIHTVNARELHAFLEIRKDFSDWIKKQLEIFTEGIDFETFPQKGENLQNQGLNVCSPEKGSNRGGHNRVDYALTIECGKHIAMMSRTEKGRQARNYFLDCERKMKSPALPHNLSEALRLAADLNDQKNAALERAKEAERTKAQIGSRREATAMESASASKREVERLKIELDRSHGYATVKRMQEIYRGMKFNWRILKETAQELGEKVINVFDQNYGQVKSYSAWVWKCAYNLEIAEG